MHCRVHTGTVRVRVINDKTLPGVCRHNNNSTASETPKQTPWHWYVKLSNASNEQHKKNCFNEIVASSNVDAECVFLSFSVIFHFSLRCFRLHRLFFFFLFFSAHWCVAGMLYNCVRLVLRIRTNRKTHIWHVLSVSVCVCVCSVVRDLNAIFPGLHLSFSPYSARSESHMCSTNTPKSLAIWTTENVICHDRGSVYLLYCVVIYLFYVTQTHEWHGNFNWWYFNMQNHSRIQWNQR